MDEQSQNEEQLRSVIEEADSGAPAVGSKVRDRFGTNEIYQRAVAYGDYELSAGSRQLFFSGIAGGFAISLTFLVYASLYAAFDGATILSQILYPIGFLFIILGGYQLYTENTLPPVALVLERLASWPALGRVFAVVLTGNFLGAGLGALVLAATGFMGDSAAVDAAQSIGQSALDLGWWQLFFRAMFAGLIVAGVVWIDFATNDTTTRFLVIYMAFLTIPVVGLYHVVVSATELLFFVWFADAPVQTFLEGLHSFILPVLLGNTAGGIILVTVVNRFQTTADRLDAIRPNTLDESLTIAEWFGGPLAGRSYIPPQREDD